MAICDSCAGGQEGICGHHQDRYPIPDGGECMYYWHVLCNQCRFGHYASTSDSCSKSCGGGTGIKQPGETHCDAMRHQDRFCEECMHANFAPDESEDEFGTCTNYDAEDITQITPAQQACGHFEENTLEAEPIQAEDWICTNCHFHQEDGSGDNAYSCIVGDAIRPDYPPNPGETCNFFQHTDCNGCRNNDYHIRRAEADRVSHRCRISRADYPGGVRPEAANQDDWCNVYGRNRRAEEPSTANDPICYTCAFSNYPYDATPAVSVCQAGRTDIPVPAGESCDTFFNRLCDNCVDGYCDEGGRGVCLARGFDPALPGVENCGGFTLPSERKKQEQSVTAEPTHFTVDRKCTDCPLCSKEIPDRWVCIAAPAVRIASEASCFFSSAHDPLRGETPGDRRKTAPEDVLWALYSAVIHTHWKFQRSQLPSSKRTGQIFNRTLHSLGLDVTIPDILHYDTRAVAAQIITELRGKSPLTGATAISWHPSRLMLAAGYDDGELCVWEWAADAMYLERVQQHRPTSKSRIVFLTWEHGGRTVRCFSEGLLGQPAEPHRWVLEGSEEVQPALPPSIVSHDEKWTCVTSPHGYTVAGLTE